MSTIKLTAIASYSFDKEGNKVEVDYGATNAKVVDGRVVFELSNSPLDNGLIHPAGGILLLYGLRDCSEEMQKRRIDARAKKRQFHYAEIEVDIGELPTQIIKPSDIKDYRFLNVRRLNAELQNQILNQFGAYMNSDGVAESEVVEQMSRMSQIAMRPDYFGRLAQRCQPFTHADVIVIPVSDKPGHPNAIRQMGFLRDKAKIVGINQSTELAEFVLPKKLAAQAELSR